MFCTLILKKKYFKCCAMLPQISMPKMKTIAQVVWAVEVKSILAAPRNSPLKICHVLHTENEKKFTAKCCAMLVQTSMPKMKTITQVVWALEVKA